MIRLATLKKHILQAAENILNKLSEGAPIEVAGAIFAMALYHLVLESLNLHALACPLCGEINLWGWGYYTRYVVYTIMYMGKPVLFQVQIEIMRLYCPRCEHAHAILPDFLIPYQSHLTDSQIRMLRELTALQKQVRSHEKTAREGAAERIAILNRYGYTKSEAQNALRIFYRDKIDWLGVTGAAEMDDIEFLDRLLNGVLRDPINLPPKTSVDMAIVETLNTWALLLAEFYYAEKRSFGTGFPDPPRRRHGEIDTDYPRAKRPYLLSVSD